MVYSTVNRLDLIFAALGEPTRRAVLERLTAGEATVTELAEPFAMSLQAFLKHVKALEDAGLVRRTRIGRTNHVALVPEAVQAAAAWLNARTPAGAAAAPVEVAPARQPDLLARARSLHESTGGRVALLRRALTGAPAADDGYDPDAAVVRALRAADRRRGAMADAVRLHEDLGRALEDVARGGDLEALRAIVFPLARLMFDLRPLLPAEPEAA